MALAVAIAVAAGVGASLSVPGARGIVFDAALAGLATALVHRTRAVPRAELRAILAAAFAAGLGWCIAGSLQVVYPPVAALLQGPFGGAAFAAGFGALAIFDARAALSPPSSAPAARP
jgi:hypothetical protein